MYIFVITYCCNNYISQISERILGKLENVFFHFCIHGIICLHSLEQDYYQIIISICQYPAKSPQKTSAII